ncbi:hypothetical protein FF125_09385 [Aureibaculum algae]|uniref:Metalloprotease n=1 Tax=Aureibaculum algae TaxID=2584122 RepID=A0A5B7TVF9_9FLAO|nr:hypothetical protein [Aureibaculum algae]QCX38632.1 hypothetical protein FF125_09385 [Aureibaculum algae]
MKKLLLLSLVSLFFITSCSEEPVESLTNDTELQALKVESAKAELLTFIRGNNINSILRSKETLLKSSNTKSSSIQGINRSNIADYDHYNSIVERVINGDDYECDLTELDYYVQSIIADWDDNDRFLYSNLGASIVFDAAYVFDNVDGGQYYGPEGQFTNQMNRTYKDLLRFWNIPTDILLRDAHGNVFNDLETVTNLLLLYGYSPEDAAYLAELMQIVYGSDKYDNFKHPLLTFNAFAARADDFWGTPKKIVMGDGLLTAYEDLGYGDVAPQTILAHEYGHHVQFAKNVVFLGTPESTRRTELMADAFAAYYLTHKRGATMNWKRVQQVLEVSYSIGDCGFLSSSHHGTPNQRRKAAAFGHNIANNTKKKGKILTAEEFIELFEDELPTLIAPDNLDDDLILE